MGLLDSCTLLLRFALESDKVLALIKDSNYLKNFPFKIYRWNKIFNSKEDASFAPVWVSLYNLPLMCFIPSYLRAITGRIGKFLRLDPTTFYLTRPSVARICVEVDLRKPLPNKVWIGMDEGFWQSIVYERLPHFCSFCNIQGHSTSVCKRKPKPNVSEAEKDKQS